MEATATLNKICHELGVCAVRAREERRAKLKKGEIITCRYCGTKFPHSGKVELQVCPGCGAKLLIDPPGEEVPREELTKFALKLVAAMRGQAAGVIEVPKLKDWTKEELEGTADLMLEDLRQERPEVLERLRKLYQETGGEPFEEI